MSRHYLQIEDEKIPQLGVVTDIFAMRKIFQSQLPGFAEGRFTLQHLKLTDYHHKRGMFCRLSYLMWVHDATTAEAGEQVFFGIVDPGGAEARYAQARLQENFQPRYGPAVHFLPELNMVLWGFPNDPELKQLPRLLEQNALRDLLREFWDSFHFPPEVALTEVDTKVVRYGPQDRCTLRHTLRLAGSEDVVIYSKSFQEKTDGELIFRTVQTLWQAPVCRSGAIIIPEPLFFARALNTVFVRGLEGVSADDHLAELDRVAAETGAALAGIHQCRIADLPRRSDEQHLASEIAEAKEILGDFETGYRARVEALAQTLRQKYPPAASLPETPIHSAFRLSQILLVAGKPAMIDFDDFLSSNPISDVGSFAAHLLFLPIREKLTEEQSYSAVREFCRAYAEHAPWGLPAAELTRQTVVYLVGKQATKLVKRPKKGSRGAVERLLRLAEDVLAEKLPLL
jgi:hypothetical protein